MSPTQHVTLAFENDPALQMQLYELQLSQPILTACIVEDFILRTSAYTVLYLDQDTSNINITSVLHQWRNHNHTQH